MTCGDLVDAHERIHLGQELGQFVAEPLRQAAGDDQAPGRGFARRAAAADSRMVSTLSSCAESMNEQVFTITTSACAASLVISTPSFKQRAEHDLGIHQVLGAAERNQADPHRAFWVDFILYVSRLLT